MKRFAGLALCLAAILLAPVAIAADKGLMTNYAGVPQAVKLTDTGTVPALKITGQAGTGTRCLQADSAGAVSAGTSGCGTVTSVGLSLPSTFTVTGSPVTGSGTLTAAYANQSANMVFAGPSSGSAAGPGFRSMVAADLPASGVTAGSYTSANITVNAQGQVTAAANGSGGSGSLTVTDGTNTVSGVTQITLSGGTVSGSTPNATMTVTGGGGGGGLWSSVLGTTPTAALTGLTNLIGTGAASADTPIGQIISGTSGSVGAYTTSVPAPPYSITALLSASVGASVNAIGWTDGTKLQFIYAQTPNSAIVLSNSNINAFAATNASSTQIGNPKLTWLRIRDDGTTVYFMFSNDGYNYSVQYSVAKASGYLGSTGYSHIFVGSPGGSGVQIVSVMSWTQGT